MGYKSNKNLLMAGTALMLVFGNSGYANAQTVSVNGADVPINTDPNFYPAIEFLTDNKATIADDVNISGNITTNITDTGTLVFSGSSTVTGIIGSSGASVHEIISNGTGEVLTFGSNVHASTVTIVGKNTVNFGGHVYANVDMGTADSTVTIADGYDIAGDIAGASVGVGTLTIKGSSDIYGIVGGVDGALSLKTINVGADGETVDFHDTVSASYINLTGTGTVNFNDAIDAQIGIVFQDNATVSFNDAVKINNGLGSIDFDSYDGKIILNSGSVTFNSDIDNTDVMVTNVGTLTVNGSTKIGGNIGATNALKTIQTGADARASEFNGNVNVGTLEIIGTGSTSFSKILNADNVIYSGTGNLIIKSSATATIANGVSFNGKNGTLTLGDNQSMAFSLDNSVGVVAGTLVLEGGNHTVSGVIGATNSIALISAGAASSTTSFTNTINAAVMDISGTGSVSLAQGLNGNLNYSANGSVTLANGKTVSGDISASSAGQGTLILSGGTQSFNGSIGSSANIGSITSSAAAANLDFNGVVGANTISVSGNDAVIDFAANVRSNNMTVTGDSSKINFADTSNVATLTISGNGADVDFAKAVTSTTINISGTTSGITSKITDVNFASTVSATTLTVSGAAAVADFNGKVTAATINVAENGGSATFDNTVAATTINLLGTGTVAFNNNASGIVAFTDGNGVVNIASGAVLTGSVTSSNNGTGVINLSDEAGITGAIGSTTKYINDLNAVANNKSVTIGGNVYSNTVDLSGSNGKFVFGAGLNANSISVTSSGTVSVTGNVDATSLTASAATSMTVGGYFAVDTLSLDAANSAITFNGDVQGTVIQGGGSAGSGIGSVTFANSTTDVETIGVGAGNVLSKLTLSGNDATVLVTGGNVIAADTTTLGNNTLSITNGTFSIGTLATQTLDVNLTSNVNDSGKIITSGAAIVGSNTKLHFTVNPTEYVADNSRYMIIDGLEGGGLVGTLASITGNNTLMISYTQDTTDHNNLVVIASRKALGSFAKSDNAIAVGELLDDIGMTGNGDLDNVQIAIQTAGNAGNSTGIANILQSLTSAADGGLISTNLNVGAMTQEINEGRLASLRLGFTDPNGGLYNGAEDSSVYINEDYSVGDDGSGVSGGGTMVNGYSFWTQAYARDAKQETMGTSSGYDAHTYGVVLGVDTSEIFEDTVLGMAFAFGQTSIKSENINDTKTSVKNYSLTLYSDYDFNDSLFMDTQLSYGYNMVNSQRHNVGNPSAPMVAEAEYDGQQYVAKAVIGYDAWLSNGLILTPMLSSTYTYLYNADYSETGAGGLGLDVKAAHISSLDLSGGVNLSTKMQSLDGKSTMKPSMHYSYSYDAIGDNLVNQSSFIGGGGTFITEDSGGSKERMNMGVGLDYATDIWTLSTVYDYEMRSDYVAHSASTRFTLQF